MRRKALEKERKAAEKRKAILEKEAEKKGRKDAPKKRSTRSQNKENQSTSTTVPLSASSNVMSSDGEQNEFSVCMGAYEDDFVDGQLQREWICCTNCSQWMHVDCLISDEGTYVCVLCGVVLK